MQERQQRLSTEVGDKPPPKAKQVLDPRADLLGERREAFKTELPHPAGEELTKQSSH
jgi:hypothetical protein